MLSSSAELCALHSSVVEFNSTQRQVETEQLPRFLVSERTLEAKADRRVPGKSINVSSGHAVLKERVLMSCSRWPGAWSHGCDVVGSSALLPSFLRPECKTGAAQAPATLDRDACLPRLGGSQSPWKASGGASGRKDKRPSREGGV